MLCLVWPFFVIGAVVQVPYGWHASYDADSSISVRLSPPQGFVRSPVEPKSFGEWLRGLPLLPGAPAVRLYDGSLKRNQNAHAAVVDIDVGDKDLQQCADAVMRLRAEYLFAVGKEDQIEFHFESGDAARFSDWRGGIRPVVSKRKVTFAKLAAPASGHAVLRSYLDTVFQFASTRSLKKELVAAPADSPPEIGDVFIMAGSPGHAVIVVDRAHHPETGEVVFLLAQSYMPAQQIQILKSFDDVSPWYRATTADVVLTPEWKFSRTDRRRFADP